MNLIIIFKRKGDSIMDINTGFNGLSKQFSDFLANATISRIPVVRQEVIDGYTNFEVNVAGFDKKDLHVQFNHTTGALSINADTPDNDENENRKIEITLDLENEPEDIKVNNGLLTFKVKTSNEPKHEVEDIQL